MTVLSLTSLMVKGVGTVTESSVSACRRRYENSHMMKSAIAPKNAILPMAIPAMAPAVRDLDECGKVEAEVALAAVDSVRDIVLDRGNDVDCGSGVDSRGGVDSKCDID